MSKEEEIILLRFAMVRRDLRDEKNEDHMTNRWWLGRAFPGTRKEKKREEKSA